MAQTPTRRIVVARSSDLLRETISSTDPSDPKVPPLPSVAILWRQRRQHFRATRDGDLDRVRHILATAPEQVLCSNAYGMTALHFAVMGKDAASRSCCRTRAQIRVLQEQCRAESGGYGGEPCSDDGSLSWQSAGPERRGGARDARREADPAGGSSSSKRRARASAARPRHNVRKGALHGEAPRASEAGRKEAHQARAWPSCQVLRAPCRSMVQAHPPSHTSTQSVQSSQSTVIVEPSDAPMRVGRQPSARRVKLRGSAPWWQSRLSQRRVARQSHALLELTLCILPKPRANAMAFPASCSREVPAW